MTTTLSETPTTDIDADTSLLLQRRERRLSRRRRHFLLTIGWIVVLAAMALFGWRLIGIGIDIRAGAAAFFGPQVQPRELQNAEAFANVALANARQHTIQGSDESAPTLENPGPGLFDRPIRLEAIFQRWRALRPLYSQILKGLVNTYDQQSLHPVTNTQTLDNPPLKAFLFTLWTWRAQTQPPANPHPNVTAVVAERVLKLNTFAEGVAAIETLILVWIWVQCRPRTIFPTRFARWSRWPLKYRPPVVSERQNMLIPEYEIVHWSQRWGDPYLLLPVAALGFCWFLSQFLTWTPVISDGVLLPPIDLRIAAVGSWILFITRFTAAVSLARFLPSPFKAPACGLVAATLVWLSPAAILGAHGTPQTEVWILPFFLGAVLLISLDRWTAAGIVLGIGCMFRAELLFAVPMLLLCPLFAAYPGRFLRISAGFFTATGLCLWPWLITNSTALRYVESAAAAALIVCAIALLHPIVRRSFAAPLEPFEIPPDNASGDPEPRPTNGDEIPTVKPVRRSKREMITRYAAILATPLGLLIAATLMLWIVGGHSRGLLICAVVLCCAVLLLPWYLSPRLWPTWILAVSAAAIWIAGWHLAGNFSWWDVGFAYAAPSSQALRLRNAGMANVFSIMQTEFGWNNTEILSRWRLPFSAAPLALNVGQTLAIACLATLVLCAIGAAIQLRARDSRFLIAMLAPWILAATLWAPLTANFTLVPATLAAILVGVSVSFSFMQLALTLISCAMIANLMLAGAQALAPATWAIIHPAFPDIAWAMPLLAATALYCSLAPRWRTNPANPKAIA
ncbi:MAG: hypothetical protein M3O30_16455 [Planctomycetota bacterium]|nr:hypothetical protein [Planctomycetota bacterium]